MTRRVSAIALGFAAVFLFAGCGPATNPKLLGVWRTTDKPQEGTIEFLAGGGVHLGGKTSAFRDFRFVGPLAEFDATPGYEMIHFQPVAEKEIEIRADYLSLLDALAGGGEVSRDEMKELVKRFKPTERVKFEVSDKRLTLTSADGKSINLERVE